MAESGEKPDERPSAAGDAGAEDKLLTVAEVAAMWRVSKMTIYRLIEAGEVPAVRVGRSYRIPDSAASRIGKRPGRRERNM